jgi:hypothetical protein
VRRSSHERPQPEKRDAGGHLLPWCRGTTLSTRAGFCRWAVGQVRTRGPLRAKAWRRSERCSVTCVRQPTSARRRGLANSKRRRRLLSGRRGHGRSRRGGDWFELRASPLEQKLYSGPAWRDRRAAAPRMGGARSVRRSPAPPAAAAGCGRGRERFPRLPAPAIGIQGGQAWSGSALRRRWRGRRGPRGAQRRIRARGRAPRSPRRPHELTTRPDRPNTKTHAVSSRQACAPIPRSGSIPCLRCRLLFTQG